MRDFLCQILAHYLIYLGSQLRLPMGGHVEQFILEAAPTRWYKEGSYSWNAGFEEDSDEENDSSAED